MNVFALCSTGALFAATVLVSIAAKGGAPAADHASSPVYLSTGEMIIAVSPNGTHVWGYSQNNGVWHRQGLHERFGEGFDLSQVLASGPIAVFPLGNRLYAFSARTGSWDLVVFQFGQLPQLSLEQNQAIAVDGSRLHLFSAESGHWATVDTND